MRGQQDTSILAIAGSDSSSGAGVQADIKTAAALGVYAGCALTCVTAQNTTRLLNAQPVAPEVVSAQMEAVFEDISPEAVKIGMAPDPKGIEAIGRVLAGRDLPAVPVVFDPVLSVSVGGASSSLDALDAMHEHLLPQVMLLTPNIPEAELLAGVEIRTDADMRRAADILFSAGVGAVLVTGGHSLDRQYCTDQLFIGDELWEFTAPRLTGEFHGTGCTLSTAIACFLAEGEGLVDAVRRGHEFTQRALRRTHALGAGSKLIDQLGMKDRT